jgi:hypothetical protein
MILTELTVTGLRRIELAALQILPGVAPDCGDQGCGKTQWFFPAGEIVSHERQ